LTTYYDDMKGHADRLAADRALATSFLATPLGQSSGDADLLRQLQGIDLKLRGLRHNRNIDIQGVATMISETFSQTEGRLAERLGLSGLFDRPTPFEERQIREIEDLRTEFWNGVGKQSRDAGDGEAVKERETREGDITRTTVWNSSIRERYIPDDRSDAGEDRDDPSTRRMRRADDR
jgi:hypothetical protein